LYTDFKLYPLRKGVPVLKKSTKISTAVIRRLPRYYRHLEALHQNGVVRISSNALGERTGLTASQIRQDLSCFGEFGQQGYGYNVESLMTEIADIMGMNKGHTAVMLGAGRLGRALLVNFPFSHYGITLEAIYDIDPKLIGTTINGIPVYPTNELNTRLAESPVDIGILTVPPSVASETANRLACLGVKGIWNFTNMELGLHLTDLVVENVHFSDSLLSLSYMISE